MKQVSRIFLIMMALVLMVGTAFAAVPGNRAQLENLPDTPDVPELKVTKDYSVKDTYHVAISAPLKDISAVANWKWIPITMDGLTGSYTVEGLTVAPGSGSWTSHWTGSWEAPWVDPEEAPFTEVYKSPETKWIEDGTWTDEDGEVWQMWAPHYTWTVRKDRYVNVEYPEWDYDADDFVYDEDGNIVFYDTVECRAWGTCAGNYEMGFAYDAHTEDGFNVKYHKSGKISSVVLEKTDAEASHFGNDKPTKVTYTWKVLYKTLYLASIVEEYAEGSTAAYFAFNGKTIGVVNK